jgi:hypothetical protein
MLAILLETKDQTIVEEFFQLFKTPWEYFRPGRKYDVIITDRQDISGLNSPLIIIFQKVSHGLTPISDNQANENDSIELQQEYGPDFPIYTGVEEITEGDKLLAVKETGRCAGSLSSESERTIIRLGFNFFEEFSHILRYGQPLNHAHVPTVDIHIANLRKWILNAGLKVLEIPPHPRGNPFFACLTHDVDFAGIRKHFFDHTMAGFMYRAVIGSSKGFLKGRYPVSHLARNWNAVISLPLVFAGLKKDFWFQFRKYVEIEENCPSTFFLVPFKDRPGESKNGLKVTRRAVRYEVSELKDEIDYILQKGCEVGVHGIDSWCRPESAQMELNKIQMLTGQSTLGVRMHWLYNDHDTPAVLEKAGYKYDSTWGYNEKPGFRAGTFQVWKPFRAETLLELPMHIMDTSLFYPDHMNLTFEQGLETIKQFTDSASSYGGVLTLNWHHRSIAPERLWDGVYIDAMDHFRGRYARFATASAVADWFEKRRSIVFENEENGQTHIKLNLSSKSRKIDSLDDLVLRVYFPQVKPGSDNKASYQEFSLQSCHEIPT